VNNPFQILDLHQVQSINSLKYLDTFLEPLPSPKAHSSLFSARTAAATLINPFDKRTQSPPCHHPFSLLKFSNA
jgi:hypothetical protein